MACGDDNHSLEPVEARSVLLAAQRERAVIERWDRDIRRAARYRVGLVGRHADANDLAQEARIRLLAATRVSEAAPEPYIRKVISNAVLAAAYRERQSVEIEDLNEEIAATPTPISDVHAVNAVERWVSNLPPRLRDVYRILYKEERTQREAARILRISQPRVAQLHRALLARARLELEHLAV